MKKKTLKALMPNIELLCKLGSIAVHVDEMITNGEHVFDRVALKGLIEQEDVKKWLAKMDQMALIPKKR